MISKAGFDGNLVINRFAKFLQYLMTLSHLSTNIDSILMNYANIMTGFSTSLSNYFTNILRLLIAFWGWGRGGGDIITVVVTGTVANIGEFPSQKAFGILMAFFCLKKEINRNKKELGPFRPF